MAEYTYDILLDRLAALCSQKEKCEHDAFAYLQKKGVPPADCQKAVDYLVKNQFISNSRYAQAFARDKARFDKWGVNKISAALALKRIDQQTIRLAVEQISPETQEETIEGEVSKKAKQIKEIATPQAKAKLLRFCASRGYPAGLSLKIIDKIINDSTY